jgi:hypothetical protein
MPGGAREAECRPAYNDFPRIAQQQRDAPRCMLSCAGRPLTCAAMTSPIADPTLQKIDDLINRLRQWHNDATKLLNDTDVQERLEHALLDVSYIFEYLKAARSEKEEKLKLSGWNSDAESAGTD